MLMGNGWLSKGLEPRFHKRGHVASKLCFGVFEMGLKVRTASSLLAPARPRSGELDLIPDTLPPLVTPEKRAGY